MRLPLVVTACSVTSEAGQYLVGAGAGRVETSQHALDRGQIVEQCQRVTVVTVVEARIERNGLFQQGCRRSIVLSHIGLYRGLVEQDRQLWIAAVRGLTRLFQCSVTHLLGLFVGADLV